MHPLAARDVWQLLEPYHAVVYFAPDARATYEAAGLKGYWMGYFASRSAAMGPIGPEVVTATFYNFHPRMVRRAIPDAWTLSTPQRVLQARYRLADITLTRTLGQALESSEIAEAAKTAREITSRCQPQGRPLFAAHRSLQWPSEPHLVLWHAATLWREFRGDGHVAALLVHDIDGCEAHVLAGAAGTVPPRQREYRGWSGEEWRAAQLGLRERGLLDKSGLLTDSGRELRQRVEDLTDELSVSPLEGMGQRRLEALLSVLTRLRQHIVAGQAVPYPNAMGLTDSHGPSVAAGRGAAAAERSARTG